MKKFYIIRTKSNNIFVMPLTTEDTYFIENDIFEAISCFGEDSILIDSRLRNWNSFNRFFELYKDKGEFKLKFIRTENVNEEILVASDEYIKKHPELPLLF